MEYANQTNGVGLEYHQARDFKKTVDWTTPGLKVTRLRLLTDPGFPVWDVSYCHGVLNGEDVRVNLPFSQVPKKNVVGFIIEEAKRDKVFAKGLGILDSISKLW